MPKQTNIVHVTGPKQVAAPGLTKADGERLLAARNRAEAAWVRARLLYNAAAEAKAAEQSREVAAAIRQFERDSEWVVDTNYNTVKPRQYN
jgi:hypothetical protein